jgi:hypothetical protein
MLNSIGFHGIPQDPGAVLVELPGRDTSGRGADVVRNVVYTSDNHAISLPADHPSFKLV